MANPNTETIKEFLVSINFDAGEDGADKLAASIESATIKANIFADVIIEVAKKSIELLIGTVARFDDLYFASERALQSVANIKAIENSMKFFGVSTEASRKSVEAMAELYRRSPGELQNIEKFGFVRDPKTGQFHYDAQVAARYQAGMTDVVVEALIKRLGIDEYFGRAIHEHPLEVGQRMKEYEDTLKEFQLDPERSAEEAHKAVESWTKLANDFGVMAESIEAKVLPIATKLLTWLDDLLNRASNPISTAVEKYFEWVSKLASGDIKSMFINLMTFGLDEEIILLTTVVKDALFYLNQFRAWAEDFFGKLGLAGGTGPGTNQNDIDQQSAATAAIFAGPGDRPHGPTDAADASRSRSGADTPMTAAKGYEGLRLASGEAVSGGPSSQGIVDLGRQIQANDPQTGEFHAFNDAYHHNLRYHSKHSEGLALDVSMKDNDYEGARRRARDYLTGLGMKEGSGGDSDFWIEPGTSNHLHVQFNSQAAAAKYESILEARRKGTSQASTESGLPAANVDLKPITAMSQDGGASPFFARNPGGRYSSWDTGTAGDRSSAPSIESKAASPWDDWKPGVFGVPSMGGGVLGGSSSDVNRYEMPQTTQIDIDGSSDPMTTAALVAQSQERISAEAARSLQRAVT